MIALKLIVYRRLRCLKGKHVILKNYEKNTKSLFMIYADFESILVPEENRKQNPDESYTNKYQK